ncbi:MAG: LamG-like jellyroll fold domain-containing protein, partial [Anaerolineae bacterium]
DGLTYLQETRLGTDPKKADSDGDGLRDDLEVKGFMLGGKRWYSDPLSPDTNNDGLLDTMECWGTLPDLTTASNKADSTTASNKACDLDTDGDGTPNLFDRDNDNDGVSDRVDLAPNKKLDGFGQSNPFKLVVDNLQKKSGSNGYPVFVDFQIRPANPDHLSYAMNVLDWPAGDKEGQIQRTKNTTFADLMNPKPPSDNANWNGDMRLVPMLEIKMPAGGGKIPALPLTTPQATRQIEGWDGATRWISATVNFRELGYRTRLDFQFENTTSGVTVELYTGLCSSPGNREYKLEDVSSGGSWDLAGRDVLTLVDGGHYIKLSKGDKSTCANLGDIPNGPYAGRMIDLEKLQTHGIAVRDADDKGNMVAYIPLNLVKDETGGGKAAFAGRMIYWPNDPTQWGSAHEVRVVWLVQMLDDAGNTNVVHSYPEEWTLTGLSVREDRGMDIAVAFEDPNTDNDLKADDRLWKLADGLQKTFTSPRDQNGNKIRDIGIVSARGGRTVADETISGRFDNQSNSYVSSEKLWGIPRNALRVKTYSYDHQDYLAKIPSEITPDILKTYFTSGGSARTDAPTLLFAREEHYRTAALDMVGGVIAISGSQVTVNMDRKKASLDTLASMNWGPYRYRNGQWEAYPLDEYWDKMAVRYKKIFQENPPKDEKGNRITDPDALEGLVIAAQSFYMAGVPGVNRVVESNYIGLITAKLSGYVADNSLAEASVNSVGAGIELVADQVAEEFFDTLRQQQEEVSEMFGNLFQEDKRGKFKVIRDLFKGKVKGLRLRNIRAAWRASRLKTAGKAAGTGLAVAALGFSIAASFSGDPIVKNITFGLAVVSTGVDLAVTIQGIAKATKGVVGFAKQMAAAGREISDSAKKAGAILTVIAIGVTIGLFVAQWAMGAIGAANSLRFSAALAGMFATIIATVIMFAISLIPIVGQIFAALVALTDAVINLICGITDSEADICKGISGYLTQAIQWAIWSQTTLVGNLKDSDRMFVKDFKPALVNVERGYSAGSQVQYGAKVGTAITLADVPVDWKAAVYAWQYNYANLDSATFKYALQPEKKDIEGVALDQMEEDWKLPDGRRPGTFENLPDNNDKLYMTPQPVSAVITLDEAGINRPAKLYLAEQYAVPTQECWAAPLPIFPYVVPVCYLRTDDNEGKSTHTDLGKNIKWDVFPATLDGFYACESGRPSDPCHKDGGYSLGWGQTGDVTFPRVKDFDGDGLFNKKAGGNDPNDSKWDSDRDGLSDAFELQKGSDPTLADSDGDGLTDYQEMLYKTNPNRQDSDGDGLTDKQEVDGWEFVYALTDSGGQLKTWVTSDPLSIDTDNDTLTDFQEKTFGFNPNVKSDLNLLDYESKVIEPDAPVMLLRFEETDGATTFSDVSGDVNNGACEGDACPVAGHSGRYGNALWFDSSNDHLSVKQATSLNLANQSFTVAFWAKRSTTGGRNMFIIGQGTQSNHRGLQVGFRDNNRFTCAFYGDDLNTPAAYTDQDWHHWACTYDASTRRRMIHRDGVPVAEDTASAPYQGSGDLLIGKAPWGDYFSGLVDEVALFRTALSHSAVQAAMEARYNLNDMVVKPGQTLTYEGTVENKLFNRYTNGLLTTDFPGRLENNVPPTSFILQPTEKQTMSGNFTIKSDATSAISVTLTQVAGGIVVDRREESGYAELWLPFNEGSGWLLFSDLSGNVPARNATCFATSTGSSCPQAGQDGVIGRAVRFDGGDDYVRTTTPIDLANKSFTVAFWAKRSGATQQRNMFVVGQGADQVNQGLHLGFRNDNSFTCAFYGNDLTTATTYWTEDVWYHFACTYDVATRQRTIYVNGVKSTQDTPSAHYGGSGNLVVGGAPWGSYFYGAVDDVRVYARSLPAEEIASLAGRPAYETDLSGKTFDGKTYTTRMDRALDLSGGQFTISAWINPQASSGWQGIWGSRFEEAYAYPSMAIDRDALRFGFGDGSTWAERITYNAVTEGAWNHVVATFDGTTYRLYVNGAKKDETSDPFSGRKPYQDNTTLMIGRASDKATVYLDHLQIIDEGDGSGNAELCIAWRNSRGGDQRGIWSNDDVDVGDYDVKKSLDFWDEGYLRIWEDDGGTYCGDNEDDGDDYVWDRRFTTNDLAIWGTQKLFTSASNDTEGHIWLGNQNTPAFKNPAIPFYGNIGKFAIYKRAMSGEEVKTLYEAESLALRLPFDEPPGVGLSSQNFANVADPTGQSRGTCRGGSCPTSGISGRVNQAALFDGRNDYVDVGSGIDLANQSFTLSAWAKRSSTGTYDLIIGQGSGDTNHGLQFGFRDINLFTCAFWGDDLNTTETYIDQKWHQWTCTYDAATRTRTIYRDGEQVKQDTASAHYQGSGDMTIGRFPNRSGFEFDGLLDDVRVYRKALSAGEARALYQSAPGLSLHFDEPEGASTFFDGSDRGHNGSCSWYSCPEAGVEGQMGRATEFNGYDDVVQLTDAGTLGLKDSSFTVMAWVRGDSFAENGDNSILGTDEESKNNGLHLVVRNGKPYMGFRGNDTAGTTELKPDVWYHLVWRYNKDKGEQAIFVNGSLDTAKTGHGSFQGNGTVYVGRALGGRYFGGRIDELAIYQRALRDKEIRDIFLYQGKWIEESKPHPITIDADPPTSSLSS